MSDWKELFNDVIRAVHDTTSPKTCLMWSCHDSIPNDYIFCYKHHEDFKEGLIDECPGCARAKEAKDEACAECYNVPVSKHKRIGAAQKPDPYRRYEPEYSPAWAKGDSNANEFFVYILRLGDGGFYAGQTRELRERLSEHRDGKVISTTGQHPRLVWFDNVPSREAATEREAELKNLIDSNPREIRRMVIKFRDIIRELDYH